MRTYDPPNDGPDWCRCEECLHQQVVALESAEDCDGCELDGEIAPREPDPSDAGKAYLEREGER